MSPRQLYQPLRKEMTLGAIWSFVETSGAGLLSFVITMVLARLLGPEHFGVVAIAYAIVAVTQPLVRSGFPTAIIQRYQLSQEHISTAFWLTMLLGCVLAVSLFSAAPWIATFYDLPLLTPVIRLLSVTVILSGISAIPAAQLTREFRFRWMAMRPFVASVLAGAVGLTLAFAGYGVWSLVWYQLVRTLSQAVLTLGGVRCRPRLLFHWSCVRDLLPVSINAMAMEIIDILTIRGREIIGGYFLGPAAAALLRLATSIIEFILRDGILNNIARVALPGYSRIQKDRARLRHLHIKITMIAANLAVPAAGGLIMVLPDLLPLAMGEKWRDSILIAQILAAGYLYNIFIVGLRAALISIGQSRTATIYAFVRILGVLILTLVCAPLGVFAIAGAHAAFGYMIFPYVFFLVSRHLGIEAKVVIKNIITPVIATIGMIAIGFLVRPWLVNTFPPTAVVAIQILLGASCYLVLLRLIWPHFLPTLIGQVSPRALQALRRSPLLWVLIGRPQHPT
jgi:polysaccharide transporter, PST family